MLPNASESRCALGEKPGNGELLSGRIQSHGETLLGNLPDPYELSTSFFDGEAQLEKSITPRALAFSGFLDLTYFVVSTNFDSKPFVKDIPYEVGRARDGATKFN